MKAGKLDNSTEASTKTAYHLCKMIRIFEDIVFVAKKVKLHQEDQALKSLSKPYQFIENQDNCHAELAILKIASEKCASKTLYIGVSKRPCYCCSLFFKFVKESKGVPFDISIVTTNGKLYGNWNKIEGFLVQEFGQVWAKVVGKRSIIEKPEIKLGLDDDSSLSGRCFGEEELLFDL